MQDNIKITFEEFISAASDLHPWQKRILHDFEEARKKSDFALNVRLPRDTGKTATSAFVNMLRIRELTDTLKELESRLQHIEMTAVDVPTTHSAKMALQDLRKVLYS